MDDPHRPRYHFLPPPAWMNDPKPFYWNGEYHVFFQYCPGSPVSGLKHWGHAVSSDLVHWRELPVALTPTPGGPDKDGCWTGCVVRDEAAGCFRILYTGVWPQAQCLAWSGDLLTWEKHPVNPVIPESQQPTGFGQTFRDPQVWWERDGWTMIVGGVAPGVGGAPFLFRSADLVRWEYRHPLYVGPAARDECPDFFPLDGPGGPRHVLLSSRIETAWAIGRYEELRFHPESSGTTDDRLFYAAKTLLDGQGRRLLFGWIREDRPQAAYAAAGWAGVLSLPRVLSLLPDNTLGMEPAPELEALRGRHWSRDDLGLGGGLGTPHTAEGGQRTEVAFEVPNGDRIEIAVRFRLGDAGAVGLVVQGSDEILYDTAALRLAGRPLALAPGEPLSLRVFVDRSVIEVFANGRVCKTIRTYHGPDDDLHTVKLVTRGGDAAVESLDVWELAVPLS
jgi:beta-fructofuranosidase